MPQALFEEENIWLPEIQPDFNILTPKHQIALRSWCDEIQPALVILDTAEAGYDASPESNRLIKKVLERYRRAVQPAAFMFTHHDRKKSKNFFDVASDSDDDTSEDSFLGWGQWERAPTATSIQLAATQADGYCLHFHKHRLGNPGLKLLRLEKNQHGFFEPQHDSQQMLFYWPDCLPPEERERVLREVKSQRGVFEDISKRTETPFETVKSQFLRGRQAGAVYDWQELFA